MNLCGWCNWCLLCGSEAVATAVVSHPAVLPALTTCDPQCWRVWYWSVRIRLWNSVASSKIRVANSQSKHFSKAQSPLVAVSGQGLGALEKRALGVTCEKCIIFQEIRWQISDYLRYLLRPERVMVFFSETPEGRLRRVRHLTSWSCRDTMRNVEFEDTTISPRSPNGNWIRTRQKELSSNCCRRGKALVAVWPQPWCFSCILDSPGGATSWPTLKPRPICKSDSSQNWWSALSASRRSKRPIRRGTPHSFDPNQNHPASLIIDGSNCILGRCKWNVTVVFSIAWTFARKKCLDSFRHFFLSTCFWSRNCLDRADPTPTQSCSSNLPELARKELVESIRRFAQTLQLLWRSRFVDECSSSNVWATAMATRVLRMRFFEGWRLNTSTVSSFLNIWR